MEKKQASVAKKTKTGDVAFVSLAADASLADVHEWLPTGLFELDMILGGGLPCGRVSMWYGPKKSGKSALAQVAVRETVRRGGIALYLDFEHDFDSRRQKTLGLTLRDKKRIVLVEPTCVEEGWDILHDRLRELKDIDIPFLIVWDSVAAAPTRTRLEKGSGETYAGARAALMSDGCSLIYRRLGQLRGHVMFINQARVKQGSMFKTIEPPGGLAMGHVLSVEAECRMIKTLPEASGVPRTGYREKVKIVKNKVFIPELDCTWVLDLAHGPSPEMTVQDALKAKHIKSVGGGKYKASWWDDPFEKDAWMDLMAQKAFRAGADDLFRARVEKKIAKALAGGLSSDDSGGYDTGE